MTLHLIGGRDAETALELCLQVLAAEDTLVLIGEEAAELASDLKDKCTLHLLAEEVSGQAARKAQIDWGRLVALCAEHERIICW